MSVGHTFNEIWETISNHLTLNTELELINCMYHTKWCISATVKAKQPINELSHHELSTLLKTASSQIQKDLSERYLREFYVEINYIGTLPSVDSYLITMM